MKNFGTLYWFELKKILKNRLMIAMILITALIVLIEAFAAGSTPRETAKAQKLLNGRQIDDALLQEMYPALTDNGRTWNAENSKYYGVAMLEHILLHDNDAVLSDYTAEDLYQKRRDQLFADMKADALTDKEIAWWKAEEAKVETPFTFYAYEGALLLAQGLSGVLLCIMMISALCISQVFTVEHRQRMDQIVLSCRNGRKTMFLVKIAAGLTTVMGLSIMAAGLLTVLTLTIYGFDGMNAAVQLEIPWSPYALTMGQFIGKQLILMLTAGILYAIFAMAMSELLKNSMAVAGIMVGLFLFSQIEIIPPQYRILSQLRVLLPVNQISVMSLAEYRLLPLGGQFVTGYVAAPFLYVIASILLLAVGAIAYNRFEKRY